MINFLPKFSEEFQNKILKYIRWQDAQLSLLGRGLLVKWTEQIKCSFNEYNLKYTSYNKPYFYNEDLNFNIMVPL